MFIVKILKYKEGTVGKRQGATSQHCYICIKKNLLKDNSKFLVIRPSLCILQPQSQFRYSI